MGARIDMEGYHSMSMVLGYLEGQGKYSDPNYPG